MMKQGLMPNSQIPTTFQTLSNEQYVDSNEVSRQKKVKVNAK